jgi:flagellar basal-body rod modification protein FlgD
MATISATPTSALFGSAPAANASAAPKTTAQEVQDRFLTLLVTQMKNQDPLNPLDNAQVTTQLAQISTVTGVDQMHQTMKAVLDQIKGLEALQAAGMDGKDVLVPSERFELGPDGARGVYELSGAASDVTVSIRSASGAVVREWQLSGMSAGPQRIEWDGTTASGTRAADGVYQMSINATSAGTPVQATTFAQAHVNGVVRGADAVQLDLGVLGRRPLSDIREVY